MVNLTIRHGIEWRAPMPLWAENSSTGIRISDEELASYPSILRFATDSFMQDFLDVMKASPKRIAEWLAQPETWREPMAAPKPALKKIEKDGLTYLLHKIKNQADQHKPAAAKALVKPRQAVTIADAALNKTIPIKLFHSTHQRFYLISASLVTSDLGCPDQVLDLSQQEKATFVLRRLVPPRDPKLIVDGEAIDDLGDWYEYAFVSTTSGHRWTQIDQSSSPACQKLLLQEEQLPLFPVSYKDGCEHDRRVLSGLIPVGKREKWMSAPVASAFSGDLAEAEASEINAGVSHAKRMFQTDVTEPWKILVEQAEFKKQGLSRTFDSLDTPDGNEKRDEEDIARRTARDNIQMVSWYVLLDFAKFLEQYLPNLWTYIKNPGTEPEPSGDELELYNAINDTELPLNLIDKLVNLDDQYLPNPPPDLPPGQVIDPVEGPFPRALAAVADETVVGGLRDALVRIRDLEDYLEAVENEFVRFDDAGESLSEPGVDEEWPDFLFPLADPEVAGPVPDLLPTRVDPSDPPSELDASLEAIDALADLVEKILPEASAMEDVIPPPGALDQRDAWFVVRCVYERPHCGPLFPALVSQHSRVFQMAPFFDPDAPARPIRIPMPVDVSPAGLRKFQKNTAFVISDMLCGKIKKIRKITLGDLVLSVLPWPFHKDLPNPGDTGPCKKGDNGFGMICSLSIPIVTLCALILLFIMVALFDLFFRWIPFLFFCLPIPGLKGKKP
jgi:hypothetical protein